LHSPAASRILRFGAFEADLHTRELRKQGMQIKLQEQPFQVLEFLLEHPGEIVTREQLRQKLWPADTFVDVDNSVNAAINRLREALGDSAESPRFVETLPRRGYRFVAPVTEVKSAEGEVTDAQPDVVWPDRRSRTQSSRGKLVLVGISAVLVVASVWGWQKWRTRVSAMQAPAHITSLAVLPLANLSGDPSQEYFADGMTDELITELAKLGEVQVISRGSVVRFKNSTIPVPDIARQLGADAVLEGSVVQVGNRARITVQLIRATTDRHMWAESYERDLKDVLLLQREIAVDVGRQISARIAEPRLLNGAHLRQIDPAAHEDYLKGLYYRNKGTPASVSKALAYFTKASTTSPFYPEAHAGVAQCYLALGGWYAVQERDEALSRARAAVSEALRQDEQLAEAHVSLGLLRQEYEWDWTNAEKEFRRAIELNPSYAEAHLQLAKLLLLVGRPDEAPVEVEKAKNADPLNLVDVAVGAWILGDSGHHDEAIRRVRAVVEMDPNVSQTHFLWGRIYMDSGQLGEASSEFRTAIRMSPSFGKYKAHLAFVLARSGDRQGARKLLDELLRSHNIVSFDVGLVLAGLGEQERALDWVEKAYQERSIELIYLRLLAAPNIYERAFYPFRSNPRFKALLKNMNYSEL
jgi:TolB-like protein/DNA-binding winged helix-turn-helix (wHTH) protein/Tfp pilus assembly protein PilF